MSSEYQTFRAEISRLTYFRSYLYCAEIAPQTYRAPISALSTGVHWCGNFIVAMVTPVGFANLSWGYYIIFTVIAAAIAPTVFLFFPETSGLSLEEIDAFFAECGSTFSVVPTFTRLRRHHPATVDDEVASTASSSEKGPGLVLSTTS